MLNRFIKSLRTPLSRSREDLFFKRIDLAKVPKHVAIIMDGNGRWAAKRGLPRLAGHRAGAEAIRRTIRAAADVGVKYLTLYAFSVENWKRPRDEVRGLMNLFEETLRKELQDLHEKGIKINVIGHLEKLPKSTQRCFKEAIELTADNKEMVLNVALNYGGRVEIADAVREIARAVQDGKMALESIKPETLADYLYTSGSPDPELLIRTSGELRVSNFLLWQIAYTELWVTPALWPDFEKADFYRAIYEFQQRKRRFGGLEAD